MDDAMFKELSIDLKRSSELLAVIAKAVSRTTMEQELHNKKLRKHYELTGTMPVKKVAERTGISVGTVSATWQKWETLGLLVKDGKSYRRVL